jgi:hypothetical protein
MDYLNGVCNYYGYLVWKLDIDEAEAALICSHLRQLAQNYQLENLEDVFKISKYEFRAKKFNGLRLFKDEVCQKDVVVMLGYETYLDYLSKMGKIPISLLHVIRGIISLTHYEDVLTTDAQKAEIIRNREAVNLDLVIDEVLELFRNNEDTSIKVIEPKKSVVVGANMIGLGDVEFMGMQTDDQSCVEVTIGRIITAIDEGRVIPQNNKETELAKAMLIDGEDQIPLFVDGREVLHPSLIVNTRTLTSATCVDLGAIGYDFNMLVSVQEKVSVVSNRWGVQPEWDEDKDQNLFMKLANSGIDPGGSGPTQIRVRHSWLNRLSSKQLSNLTKVHFYYLGGNDNTYNWMIGFKGGRTPVRETSLKILFKIVPKIYKLSIILAARKFPWAESKIEFLRMLLTLYGFQSWEKTMWDALHQVMSPQFYRISQHNEVYTKDEPVVPFDNNNYNRKSFRKEKLFIPRGAGKFKEVYTSSYSYQKQKDMIKAQRLRVSPGKTIQVERKVEQNTESVDNYTSGFRILEDVFATNHVKSGNVKRGKTFVMNNGALDKLRTVYWTEGLFTMFLFKIGADFVVDDISCYTHIILKDGEILIFRKDETVPTKMGAGIVFSSAYTGVELYGNGEYTFKFLDDVRKCEFVSYEKSQTGVFTDRVTTSHSNNVSQVLMLDTLKMEVQGDNEYLFVDDLLDIEDEGQLKSRDTDNELVSRIYFDRQSFDRSTI